MADDLIDAPGATPGSRLSFRDFIATEPTLTAEQRDLLISIYTSWDL